MIRLKELVLAFAGLAALVSPIQAQQGATSNQDQPAPRPSRKSIAESRRDDDAPLPKKPDSAAEKKAEEKQEPRPGDGFFGDTRNFTKLSGWGSFGNAMGQFGFARTTLVMLPPVQEELKMTDAQKKKLQEWQESLRKKGEEMGRSMREKNGDDPFKAAENQPITARITQFTTLMNQVSRFVRENEEGLAKVLNANQRKRLDQIALQMEGITALTRTEIADKLGLLPEQREEIDQIIARSRAQQMTTWVGSMMSMRNQRRNGEAAGNNEAPGNDAAAGNGATPAQPKAAKSDRPTSTRKTSPKAADDKATEARPDPQGRAEREKAMRQQFETMRSRTDQIHASAVKQISQILLRGQRIQFEGMMGPPFDPKKINTMGRPPRRQPDGAPANPPDEPNVEKKADAQRAPGR